MEKMETKSQMITAQEVAGIMNIGIGKAYKLIRAMNDELQKMGKITVLGKINRRFFEKKFYVD